MIFKIESLEIDDHILEKIESKHGVTFEEVEEILKSTRNHVRKDQDDLFKVYGQTTAGRYLLAIVVQKGITNWKIVTARQMTANEKRRYKQVTR